MTIEAIYEPRIFQISVERYADTAIDAGLWLVGEWLAQGRPTDRDSFVPDSSFYFKPRYLQAAIVGMSQVNEVMRHQVFIAGFLRAPYNGCQQTFRRLLVTHAAMLNEAFRSEWRRKSRIVVDTTDQIAASDLIDGPPDPLGLITFGATS
jgi:hypothetical protein